MNRLGWSLVCALALGACDGGNSVPDAGTDAGGPPAPAVQVVTMRDGDGNPTEFGPANFGCRGSVTAPSGSGDVTFTVTAKDFFDGNPVEGLMVQFFPDGMPTLDQTCTGMCQAVTTDASGQASVMGSEGAWYAYRVLPGSGIDNGTPSDYIGVVQFNEETPADGGNGTLNVVKGSTRDSILLLLGVSQEDGTAVVTGEVLDCDGAPVSNATVRVFDSSGEIPLGFARSGPRAFYFNGASSPTPRGAQRMTNNDGLFGAANVPLPSDNQLRVETWGALTEGGQPEMLGCEQIQVGADGITIINVGGTRSDGPSGCSGN